MLTLLAALLALVQPPQPAAPAAPCPESQLTRERLLATLAALPTARSARGDIPSQQGLAATETLLIQSLKDLGYEPTLEPLSWNLDKQAALEARLKKEGKEVETRGADQTTPELSARTWHNIIVEIPGRELPAEVLVVSAHFDAVPGSPGADDDGTAVAALLEAARILKDRPMRRTVRLAFFNLEEIGLLGSKQHVRSWVARRSAAGPDQPPPAPPAESIIGMVSLEMLGYFSDAPQSQRSPIPPIKDVFEPPTVGDFVGILTTSAHSPFAQRWAAAMLRAAPGLKVAVADKFPFAPPDFLRSDHAPFLLAGLPALMLTDTSNFRNPHYHKPTDTIATLDPDRFTLVAQGVVGAIHALAEPFPSPNPKAGEGASRTEPDGPR